MEGNTVFSDLLRGFREERGFSQKDLVVKDVVSQALISQFETGKSKPKPVHLECLSKTLKLSIAEKRQLFIAAGFLIDNDRTYELVTPPEFRSVLTVLGDPTINELPGPLARGAVKEFVDSWHLYAHAKEKQYMREWRGTEEVCRDAIKKLRGAANRLEAYLYDAMGSAALHFGNLTEAERRFQHMERLLKDLDDPYLEGQLLTHQGELLRIVSDWKQAEIKFQAANKVFLALEDNKKGAWIDRKLGLLYLLQGEWVKGIRYLERSESVFEETEDKYEMAKTYLSLGWAHTMKGDWHRALQYRQKGFELSQSYKVMNREPDAFLKMQGHVYMGLTLNQMGSVDEGRRHLEAAKTISDRLEETHERSTIFIGLGHVYFDIYRRSGKKDKPMLKLAQKYFEVAASETKATGDKRRYGRSLIYWSTLSLEPGEIDRAIDLLEEARRIFRALEHHYFLATVAVNLGWAYLRTRAYGPLNVCVNEGIQEAQSYRFTHYRQLSELRILKARWVSQELSLENGKGETIVKHLADAMADAVQFNRFQCEKISDQIVDTLLQDKDLRKGISKWAWPIRQNFEARMARDKQIIRQTPAERKELEDDVIDWLGKLRKSSSAKFPKKAQEEFRSLMSELHMEFDT